MNIGIQITWQVKGVRDTEFKEVKIEHRVKALVVLNLQSYGGGRDVFGLGSSPDSLARKGFQVPIFNDGYLEVRQHQTPSARSRALHAAGAISAPEQPACGTQDHVYYAVAEDEMYDCLIHACSIDTRVRSPCGKALTMSRILARISSLHSSCIYATHIYSDPISLCVADRGRWWG